MKRQYNKVYVGLSGGVDSSVSAALLQKAGYDVTGVFIKIWSPEWTECTSREDRLDAMRVCAHLGLPFREIDLTHEYKSKVVDYMISEYAKGRTPNPDVMCNRSIKFGMFFDWAMKNGADYVATGHYARIEKKDGVCHLFVAKDASKDQSYFLWTLTQNRLSRTLFPVGNLDKTKVRVLAKKLKLPTALKKDSQGLCFVGHIDIKEFLSRYVHEKRGDVLNKKGEVIGYHRGSHLLTIGERHGFTVTEKTPSDAPLYIAQKDTERNTITVTRERGLVQASNRSVNLSEVSWISKKPEGGRTYEAQIRYHGKRYKCRVQDNTVKFLNKPGALALGQSFVLYDKKICLGGGIIDSYGV
ncbi:MAG: hypothetical protein RIQ56_536 [Candidatus Parcubacteria bacterium]